MALKGAYSDHVPFDVSSPNFYSLISRSRCHIIITQLGYTRDTFRKSFKCVDGGNDPFDIPLPNFYSVIPGARGYIIITQLGDTIDSSRMALKGIYAEHVPFDIFSPDL